MEIGDADLGSGGPLVIPGTNLVIGGGKTGYMYLLDRGTMQLVQRLVAATNRYDPNCRAQSWEAGPHIHGSPTFWQGTNFLYVWAEKDFLSAYALDPATGRFGTSPAHQSTIEAQPLTMPGGMISLSANGTDTATGIVWAILSTDNIEPGKGTPRSELLAFDARNVEELLWSGPIALTPHWAPPTIAEGKVFVSTLNAELMAYGLGPDPNDIHWTPYEPKLAYQRCRTCHSEAQPEEFFRRQSLLKYYINEASVFALPAYTLHQLFVPAGLTKGLVLEGNGTATYVAEASTADSAKLVWKLKQTTAELSEFQPDPNAKETTITVHLTEGAVWTAVDGSSLGGREKRSVPAPVSISLAWASFEVLKTEGQGLLSGYSFVQRVQTHGGAAPATPPAHQEDTTQVRFAAEYWFYRKGE